MIKSINFAPGDIIRVFEKVKEINADSKDVKTRIQVFEGVVIAIRGRNEEKSFTVRKVVDGIGVEKVWQVNSPNIEKVVLKEHPKNKIKRSKLYHLRKQTK